MRYTHTRNAWVTTRPVDGPAFNWDTIDFFVVHWPGHDGVPDGDIGDRTDIAAYIRNTHHGYLDDPRRGYSLGYSSFADYLGGTWECRGDTFRAASNAPQAFNRRAFSCNYLTDLDGNHTPQGVAAVNDLIAQVRERRPHVKVVPHRDGPLYVEGATPTQCPGNKIAALIANGTIGAAPAPPPSPSAPPPAIVQGVLDMVIVARDTTGPTIWFSPNGGLSRHAIRNMEHLNVLLKLGALDAASGNKVTTWQQCTPLTPAQLDHYIGHAT